jgi:imidazolonepropionase-like amidohydrolase
MLKMIGQIHENKIEIMAGTDTPIGYLTPGLSLHEELNLLVKSGLSPLEAIKTATMNPAKYFNLDDELGLIEENMFADLVILDANPLENINNTKQINAVLKQGNYFDRTTLDQILKNINEK